MNKYWFRKRKGLKSIDVGWGWIPVSWEGWLSLILIVILVFLFAAVLNITSGGASLSQVLFFVAGLAVIVVVASLLSRSKTQPNSPESKK